jgi:2-C-methyl-D-erythritol 4-phosphate cytidylyltransferase
MPQTHVIIVAAGSGTRFGSPKQLVPLLGKTLYRHSVDTFVAHPDISRIVLVASDDVRKDIEKNSLDPKIEVIAGGSIRMESVWNGIQTLFHVPDDDVILVHDAARPGVTAKIISDVTEMINLRGAALAAIPLVDTIKREDEGKAVNTIPRVSLWRAQTPQGARRVILLNAYKTAINDDFEGTDEAELLEHIQVFPTLVTGADRNMKVTYPEDIELVGKLMN